MRRITGRKLQAIRARHFQQNPLCVECMKLGKVKVWDELDHVKALVNGGLDSGERQGLCREHHAIKTAKDMGYKYRPKVRIGLSGWPIEEGR